VPLSRKSFEATLSAAPDHPPTLNNLAVIYWKQNQQGSALNFYDKAMLAMPNSEAILDNVAEALNALPAAMKNGSTAQKLARRFNDQDAQLQHEMLAKGLYRWGGSYVDQKQMDQIQAIEKEHKDLLSKLATDYDAANAKLSTIDEQIRRNERTMFDIQATSVAVDQFGNVSQVPYPPSYWDAKREVDNLSVQKKDLQAKLEQLRRSAKIEEQKAPVVKYSGIQRIIGEDAAPVNVGGAAKATAQALPATVP